jgi:pilus assembly protein Flp/PilA
MSRLSELSTRALIWFKLRDRRGASAIEYGLLGALVALVIIVSITSLGTNLRSVFSRIATSI